jgi:hypothetical protein
MRKPSPAVVVASDCGGGKTAYSLYVEKRSNGEPTLQAWDGQPAAMEVEDMSRADITTLGRDHVFLLS